MVNFEIQHLNWHKRRAPTTEPQPTSIRCDNFKKEENHFCEVYVQYDDGVERKLLGRVIHNQIKGHWAINAIANGGFNVSVIVRG